MKRIDLSENNFSKIKTKMKKYEKPLKALYRKLTRKLSCPNGFCYGKKKIFWNQIIQYWYNPD